MSVWMNGCIYNPTINNYFIINFFLLFLYIPNNEWIPKQLATLFTNEFWVEYMQNNQKLLWPINISLNYHAVKLIKYVWTLLFFIPRWHVMSCCDFPQIDPDKGDESLRD